MIRFTLYTVYLGPEPKPVLSGNSRTYRVWMDTNQYQRDMARVMEGEEVSDTSNVMFSVSISTVV